MCYPRGQVGRTWRVESRNESLSMQEGEVARKMLFINAELKTISVID